MTFHGNILSFVTPGSIDMRAINTFGLSAKDNENPIGYFGTGLKYALAVLERLNHKVSITSDEGVFSISSKVSDFRGKEFSAIYCNNQPLPFTTELGKNWEVWMAFREIYSNTLDEGGKVEIGAVDKVDGSTVIRVEGEAFFEVFTNLGLYFLNGKTPLHRSGTVEIYGGSSNYVYYRGIRALELEKPTLYTYNVIARLDLTEDRTIAHDYMARHWIQYEVVKLTETSIIQKVVLASNAHYEYDLRYPGEPSSEFLDVIRKLYPIYGLQISAGAMVCYREHTVDPAVGTPYDPNDIEIQTYNNAVSFCKAIGFNTAEYPVQFVESLGSETAAVADRTNYVILLSRMCFDRGTKYLASTLIEEYIHLKFGVDDCTRQMQNNLFGHIVRLGEQYVWKKPL